MLIIYISIDLNNMHALVLYIIGLALYIVIDSLYLRIFAKNFYVANMNTLLIHRPSFIPAIISWMLIVGAITVFVLPKEKGYIDTLIYGLTLGFFIYGIYNMSNYSILTQWGLKLALADWLWGILLVAFISLVMKFLMVHFDVNLSLSAFKLTKNKNKSTKSKDS